jgi:GDP-mannose mannosyl hydrolase
MMRCQEWPSAKKVPEFHAASGRRPNSRGSDHVAGPVEDLTPEQFSFVVRHAPLVSIDLVIRDPDGCVLVAWRNNEPARNCWFVPGGRIRKNERIADAFARIVTAETGLAVAFAAARLLGAYEHVYPTNRFGEPGYGTHYVVLAYEVALAVRPEISLDDQHGSCAWMAEAALMAAPDVHANVKAYFR